MTTDICNDIQLTKDQSDAIEAIVAFWESDNQLLTLGGFAGTGKTTLIANAVSSLRESTKKRCKHIAFCSFTGRAASVLRGKLSTVSFTPDDYCGTIHRLIYTPILQNGKISGWKKKNALFYDLIVVDEASMVSKEIFKDLTSYNIPIIAVGDHGQLPPVGDTFNLLQNPKVKLTTIHRQAANNPIIKLSMMARTGEFIPYGFHGNSVMKSSDRNILEKVRDVENSTILCGFNTSRVKFNTYIRQRLGFTGIKPSPGDKLICLKNNRDLGLYNGTTCEVIQASEFNQHWYYTRVRLDTSEEIELTILKAQFNQEKTLTEYKELDTLRGENLFDFGYAMTVHKAQGSESDQVVLFCQRHKEATDEYYNRWLYTGITRASDKLILVE